MHLHDQVASPDYSLVTAIEGRALRNEDKGPVPWIGLRDQVVERTPGKSASRGSSTKDFIEAVRLDVFTPPGSPFDRHSVVVFPVSMNNPGWLPGYSQGELPPRVVSGIGRLCHEPFFLDTHSRLY